MDISLVFFFFAFSPYLPWVFPLLQTKKVIVLCDKNNVSQLRDIQVVSRNLHNRLVPQGMASACNRHHLGQRKIKPKCNLSEDRAVVQSSCLHLSCIARIVVQCCRKGAHQAGRSLRNAWMRVPMAPSVAEPTPYCSRNPIQPFGWVRFADLASCPTDLGAPLPRRESLGSTRRSHSFYSFTNPRTPLLSKGWNPEELGLFLHF